MKDLLKYMKHYKKESVLGPLFKLFEALLELLVPLVVAAIIDKGIANKDIGYVVRMCVLLIAIGIIGLFFSVTAQYFAAKASVGFVKKIRYALFSHFQDFSYSKIDNVGTSAMITRITSDANQIQNGVNLTLRLFLRSPFVVFGAMIMAFTIDVKSALVFLGVIPVLSVVVFGIMLITIPLYKKVQKGLEAILEKTRENLAGVRVIRAFCKEDEETEEFKKRNSELNNVQRYVGRISALMNPLTYVIINLGIIILIKTGALRVYEGIITQGAVVALYNYMTQILTELIKFANLIINITKSIASGNRIAELLNMKTDIKENEEVKEDENYEYSVEFINAFLRYENAKDYSVTNADFKVKKGETVGIIGPTGSGKTSLVDMIPFFYPAEKGEVKVNGIDVSKYPVKKLRSKIGIVPQKAVLFSGSIRENMLWGNENATDEDIYDALKTAQAKEIADSKEGGLNYIIEQDGRNLSGGQKQRLTIARALVKKPEILILDDSASALDYATDANLRKAIRESQKDTTVFIVSQRTSSIQYADKIVVMYDGIICDVGKHDELMERCEVYREIYNSQFKGGDGNE